MGTKLYVGNLSFNTTETDLQDLFGQVGAVSEVTLMQDKFTGKSRGFAFVTMGSEADAQKAIAEFNGKTIEGRSRLRRRWWLRRWRLRRRWWRRGLWRWRRGSSRRRPAPRTLILDRRW